MTGTTALLALLFIISIGISTILYVSKTMKNFQVMAGWGLAVYLMFAFAVLLMIVDDVLM